MNHSDPYTINRNRPINWEHPLNQSLTNWWINLPLTRNGLTWIDLAGRVDGTLQNMNLATDWTKQRPGGWGSCSFDKVDNRVLCGKPPILNNYFDANGGSFCVWVNATSLGKGNAGQILYKRLMSAYLYSPGATNNFAFRRDNWGRWHSTDGFNFGEWVHFGLSYEGVSTADPLFYINGVLAGTTRYQVLTGANADDSGFDFYIGSDLFNNEAFEGLIDDLRMWRRVLSPSEFTANYLLSKSYYPDVLDRIRPAYFFVPTSQTSVGSIEGTSSFSGTLQGKAHLAGTVSSTSSLSGTLRGTGSLEGEIAAEGLVSGTLTATAEASGSISSTSSWSGTVTPKTTLIGSAASTSTFSGTLKGRSTLSGLVAATTDFSGNLKGSLELSGSITASSTFSGSLTASTSLQGTIAGTGSLTGVLKALGLLQGTIPSVGTFIGTTQLPGGFAAGTLPSTTTFTGALTGIGRLQGSILNQGSLSGSLVGLAELQGLIEAISDFDGTLTELQQGLLEGLITSESDFSGTLSGTAFASGNIIAQASLAGTLLTIDGNTLILEVLPGQYIAMRIK